MNWIVKWLRVWWLSNQNIEKMMNVHVDVSLHEEQVKFMGGNVLSIPGWLFIDGKRTVAWHLSYSFTYVRDENAFKHFTSKLRYFIEDINHLLEKYFHVLWERVMTSLIDSFYFLSCQMCYLQKFCIKVKNAMLGRTRVELSSRQEDAR